MSVVWLDVLGESELAEGLIGVKRRRPAPALIFFLSCPFGFSVVVVVVVVFHLRCLGRRGISGIKVSGECGWRCLVVGGGLVALAAGIIGNGADSLYRQAYQ